MALSAVRGAARSMPLQAVGSSGSLPWKISSKSFSPGRRPVILISTSGAITKRVDRLEDRGYVIRKVCTDDARSRKIRLTRRGLTLIDDLVPKHLANERRLLAGLNDLERTRLAGLLEAWGRDLGV